MVRRLSTVRPWPAALLLLLLPACAARQEAPVVTADSAGPRPVVEVMPEDGVTTAWQSLITAADKDRLARAHDAWAAARADVAAERMTAAMAAEGAAVDPDAALPRAAPSPGPYECRMVRLGRQRGGAGAGSGSRGRAFTAFKPFACYVEAEGSLLTIVKQTGTERPAGRLWPDGDDRMVFLGAVARDAEGQPPAYGADADRDVVGYVERVAPFRWRLVMPWPHGDSLLDILELSPLADPIARPPA